MTGRLAVAASLWLLILWISSPKELPAQESEPQILKPEQGERCLLCGVLLTPEDAVLLVRGRRVPLNKSMVDSFLQNQEQFFARLQPKSALFQENLEAPTGMAQGGIGTGWFFFGIYVLCGLVFSGLSGYRAISKGLPVWQSFLLGLFFTAFGYVYVLSRNSSVPPGPVPSGLVKIPTTYSPIPCEKCQSPNHPSAETCSACGAALNPAIESEVRKVSPNVRE